MVKKWEYKVVDVTSMSANEIRQELNLLGGKGWELVAVTDTDTLAYNSMDDETESGGETVIYLKREKSDNNSHGDENIGDEEGEDEEDEQ